MAEHTLGSAEKARLEMESLVREPNRERGLRMLRRIRDDLSEEPDPRPWVHAAHALVHRLIIGDDAFYYLVELFTECLVGRAAGADPELTSIVDEMHAIERAHGLTDVQAFRVGEAPADWRALNDRWEARADAIIAEFLRSIGYPEVANLLLHSRQQFDERAEAGYDELWGDDD
jgi:hypothetical protein